MYPLKCLMFWKCFNMKSLLYSQAILNGVIEQHRGKALEGISLLHPITGETRPLGGKEPCGVWMAIPSPGLLPLTHKWVEMALRMTY